MFNKINLFFSCFNDDCGCGCGARIINIRTFTGITGPTGATGATGPAGATGATGEVTQGQRLNKRASDFKSGALLLYSV